MSVSRSDLSTPWGLRDVAAGLAAAILLTAALAIVGVAVGERDALRIVLLPIVGTAVALFGLAITRIARAPTRPYLRCAIFGAIAVVAIHFAADFIEDDATRRAVINTSLIVIGHVVLLVAFWTFTRGKHRATARQLRLNIPKPLPSALFKGVTLWIAALAVVAAWSWIVESAGLETLVPPDNAVDLMDEVAGIWPLAILVASFTAPIAEELFFRSFLLGGIMKRFGPVVATLSTSAFFALAHLSPEIGAGIVAPVFIIGVALAVTYLWTRSVWISMFVHSLHNTATLVAVEIWGPVFDV